MSAETDLLQAQIKALEVSRLGLAAERDKAIEQVTRLNLACQRLQQESIYITGKVSAILKLCVQLNDGKLVMSTKALEEVGSFVLVRNDENIPDSQHKNLIYTLRKTTEEERKLLEDAHALRDGGLDEGQK